jgi:hypothetical protein
VITLREQGSFLLIIAVESWTKGKFPPSLKPLLAQVALKAVVLGEYDENFFSYMPKLFPYNKFTMSASHFVVCASKVLLSRDAETDQTNNMEGPYDYTYGSSDRVAG